MVKESNAADKQGLDLSATVDELRAQLGSLNLDTRGNKVTLKKRLASCKKKAAEPARTRSRFDWWADFRRRRRATPLEYLLVIDFEATCWRNNLEDGLPSQEIIEFPIVLVDLKARRIVKTFTQYVQPIKCTSLSAFCIQLTGITQDQVDKAKAFPKVLRDVEAWITEHCKSFEPSPMEQSGYIDTRRADGIVDTPDCDGDEPRYRIRNWSIATDGKADLEFFLATQVALSGIGLPGWAVGPYIDTRALFASYSKIGRVPLSSQLAHLGLEFEGREHCGLDDAVNIARVVLELQKRGCGVHVNRFIEAVDCGKIGSKGECFLPTSKMNGP